MAARTYASRATPPSLEVLDLEDNLVKHRGAKALARALSHDTCLTMLNLGGNLLCDSGASALLPALHNGNLCSLDLSDNRLSGAAAPAIAALIRAQTPLTMLSLQQNDIDANGRRTIARALRGTPDTALVSLLGFPLAPYFPDLFEDSDSADTAATHLLRGASAFAVDAASSRSPSGDGGTSNAEVLALLHTLHALPKRELSSNIRLHTSDDILLDERYTQTRKANDSSQYRRAQSVDSRPTLQQQQQGYGATQEQIVRSMPLMYGSALQRASNDSNVDD